MPRVDYLHTSIYKRPALLSGHKADPQGWPLNRGATVINNYDTNSNKIDAFVRNL